MEVLEMGRQRLEEVLEKAGLFAEREAQAEARGEARAKIERSKEIAQNLIKKGWDRIEIAETTGLDILTVESLYNEAHT